jgi:hypothetical protein
LRQLGTDEEPEEVAGSCDAIRSVISESVSTTSVMDEECLPSVAPGTEVEDNGSESSGKRCCKCSEGKHADDAEISMDTNPSTTADYEQERQQERQERKVQ